MRVSKEKLKNQCDMRANLNSSLQAKKDEIDPKKKVFSLLMSPSPHTFEEVCVGVREWEKNFPRK